MSGGAFDYKQYVFEDIIDSIQESIDHATGPRPPKVKEYVYNIYVRTGPHSENVQFPPKHWPYETIEKNIIGRGYVQDGDMISEEDDSTEVRFIDPTGKLPSLRLRGFWYEHYEDNEWYPDYSDETIQGMKDAIEILRKATVAANAVDWLVSGDDGEEDFLEKMNSLKK